MIFRCSLHEQLGSLWLIDFLKCESAFLSTAFFKRFRFVEARQHLLLVLLHGITGACGAGVLAWLYVRKRARTAAADGEKPLKPAAGAKPSSSKDACSGEAGSKGSKTAEAAAAGGEAGKEGGAEGATAEGLKPKPVAVDPSAVEALLAALRAEAAQALARKPAAQAEAAPPGAFAQSGCW